jgi:hypothetical protein
MKLDEGRIMHDAMQVVDERGDQGAKEDQARRGRLTLLPSITGYQRDIRANSASESVHSTVH